MNHQTHSLGMIETLGFPGLVAAADAAVKAADVQVMTYQRADSGIVTIYIIGDVASVQAAVAVGKERAERVGQLRYAHVIARPDEGVFKMINKMSKNKKEKKVIKSPGEKAKDNDREPNRLVKELNKKTVTELRKQANAYPQFSLTAQEIKIAKKDELVKHLSELELKKGGDKS